MEPLVLPIAVDYFAPSTFRCGFTPGTVCILHIGVLLAALEPNTVLVGDALTDSGTPYSCEIFDCFGKLLQKARPGLSNDAHAVCRVGIG